MPTRGAHRSGGGRNKPSGKQPQSREEVVSRAMSYVLRHGAEKEGLKLDEGGYINCQDLLLWSRLHRLNVTFPELRTIVSTNPKQRFALLRAGSTSPNQDNNTTPAIQPTSSSTTSSPSPDDPSAYLIRATQGHSLAIASKNLLTPLLPSSKECPKEVVHGTYADSWDKILKSGGVKRMGRRCVHFAIAAPSPASPASKKGDKDNKKGDEEKKDNEGLEIDKLAIDGSDEAGTVKQVGEEKVVSGMRASANILIWVDVKKSAQEGGLKWWKSANGVVLTEGDEQGLVALKWLTRVERRGTGEVIWRPDHDAGK